MSGSARIINGLYYYMENQHSGKIAKEFHSIYSISSDEQIMV